METKYYLDYAVGIWVLMVIATKTENVISVDEAIKWSKRYDVEMSLDARGLMDTILEDYEELNLI